MPIIMGMVFLLLAILLSVGFFNSTRGDEKPTLGIIAVIFWAFAAIMLYTAAFLSRESRQEVEAEYALNREAYVKMFLCHTCNRSFEWPISPS